MAFALTRFQAYGIEIDEATTKRFKQYAELQITALAADVALDLGNNTGTFWGAVGGTEPGTTALQALKDIQLRAKTFLDIQGLGVNEYVRGTAAAAGVYTISIQNLRPNVTYNAANGPLVYDIVLTWELNDNVEAVSALKSA